MEEPIIESNRLILRKPSNKDAFSLLSILNDEDVNTFVPSLFITSYDEAIGFLEILYTYDYDNDFFFVLEEKITHSLVGIISAYWTTDNKVPISYVCKKDCRGTGFMPEAVEEFINYLKNNFAYDNVTFSINVKNKSSQRVMKKLNIPCKSRRDNYLNYSLSLK